MQVLAEYGAHRQGLADIRPQLARIRVGFLVRLEDRCAEMDRLATAIDLHGFQPHLIERLAEHAHKIAGVALTLGFLRLGALAGKTDAAIAELRSHGDWMAMRALMEDFLDEIEHVLETQAPDQDRCLPVG